MTKGVFTHLIFGGSLTVINDEWITDEQTHTLNGTILKDCHDYL